VNRESKNLSYSMFDLRFTIHGLYFDSRFTVLSRHLSPFTVYGFLRARRRGAGLAAGALALSSDVAGALAGSVAPPELTHAFQPPSNGRTLLKPFPSRSRAAPALVASLGQAQ
jgi:hypothetical protein